MARPEARGSPGAAARSRTADAQRASGVVPPSGDRVKRPARRAASGNRAAGSGASAQWKPSEGAGAESIRQELPPGLPTNRIGSDEPVRSSLATACLEGKPASSSAAPAP